MGLSASLAILAALATGDTKSFYDDKIKDEAQVVIIVGSKS